MKLNQLNNLLHDSLIATGHVERCAIVDKKEAEVKANSPGFLVSRQSSSYTVLRLSRFTRLVLPDKPFGKLIFS